MQNNRVAAPACACCTLSFARLLGAAEHEHAQWLNEIKTALKPPAQIVAAAKSTAQLFYGGTIYTLRNGEPNQVAALGVADGKVEAVGTVDQVKAALKGMTVEQIDLKGKTLLPGFIEPHMHILPSAMLLSWVQLGPFLEQCLRPGYSKEWIAEQLKQALEQTTSNEGVTWVLGAGVDPSLMEVWTDPDQAFLDSLSTTIPIFLLNASGHIGYANSAAMKIANIQADKGILTEEEISKILPYLPKPGVLAFLKNFQTLMQNAASLGITSVFDAGLGAAMGSIEVGLLKMLAHSPFTPVRMAAALFANEDKQLEQWLKLYKPPTDANSDERFSIKAIKLVSDGSNQGLTGYQSENYDCAHEHPLPGVSPRGLFNFEPPITFAQRLQRVIDHGWPVLVHANGDQAIAYVLAAYELALHDNQDEIVAQLGEQRSQNGIDKKGLRHRLEHASLLDDACLSTMSKLGISPSFLIGHVGYWGYVFQKTILGEQRAQLLDRCQSAQAAGLRISLHSDHFVSPLGPLRMMEQAITRVMEAAPVGSANVLNAQECLDRVSALRAVTYDAAWQCHLEQLVGSLEPGKLADMVILEQDPLSATITALRDIPVRETWLAGKRVYHSVTIDMTPSLDKRSESEMV